MGQRSLERVFLTLHIVWHSDHVCLFERTDSSKWCPSKGGKQQPSNKANCTQPGGYVRVVDPVFVFAVLTLRN